SPTSCSYRSTRLRPPRNPPASCDPSPRTTTTLCGSVVDGGIVEWGHVCSQSPAPGTRQGGRLLVTVRTQTEDQQHGNVGQANEWHLMPDVAGMTQDEAMSKIREAGFTDAAAIQIGNTSERSCPIRRVCRTYPNALERGGQKSMKT